MTGGVTILLSIPKNAGRIIVETGAVIACPLLRTSEFVKHCKERNIDINRERLLRFERLGFFAPVFRVKDPDEEIEALSIPPAADNNWFEKGWAWDTTQVGEPHQIPELDDHSQEGYYSIFQIDHLEIVLSEMTFRLQLDGFLEAAETKKINWEENGGRWLGYAQDFSEGLREHEYRRAVALLCQFISNRYFPLTQSDNRTIQVPLAPQMRFDQWIKVYEPDWDWRRYVRSWDAQEVVSVFDLTPEKLRHAYNGLAVEQTHSDPLEKWYQLVQFINVRERRKLKGDALKVETLRSGALMLRALYQDLYDEELPPPNEVVGTVITHIPEMEVRENTLHHLEYVANRFGVNPKPKVSLIVEGESEEVAVAEFFKGYYGVHPGKLGIEVIPLRGVDFATGGKADRFRAIFRLIDYLHHHQTITFLILDNEGYAHRLKTEAQKLKSIHHEKRFVTRPEYIRIWKTCYEFENYSCTEIAEALTEQSRGKAKFSRNEVGACKKERNPGAAMSSLYKNKTGKGLLKPKLSEALVQAMFSEKSRRKLESRPLTKTLLRVSKLAALNHFPTMHDIWEKNQASKFLGKKHKR